MTTSDNFSSYGFSNQMGPKLRELVEQQLLDDLSNYQFTDQELAFDWSSSCIESHSAYYLDGSLENFSSISLYNKHHETVAEGWMEFILTGEFFLVYWDNLTTWENGEQITSKKHFGIPPHVWQKIPSAIRGDYEKERIK